MNPSFYMLLALVFAKILLHSYAPDVARSLVLYTLQSLALTLWIAPLIWQQGFRSLNALSLKPTVGFWSLPLMGFLLVNIWFLPALQALMMGSLGGDLLALGASLLGGVLCWAPLLSRRLPLWGQCGYIFVLTLTNVSLMLLFRNLSLPLSELQRIAGSPLHLTPWEESTLAIAMYQAGWLFQLLVLGLRLFRQWATESATWEFPQPHKKP